MKQFKPLILLLIVCITQSLMPFEYRFGSNAQEIQHRKNIAERLSIPELQERVKAVTHELAQGKPALDELNKIQDRQKNLNTQLAELHIPVARINQAIEALKDQADAKINQELDQYNALRLAPKKASESGYEQDLRIAEYLGKYRAKKQQILKTLDQEINAKKLQRAAAERNAMAQQTQIKAEEKKLLDRFSQLYQQKIEKLNSLQFDLEAYNELLKEKSAQKPVGYAAQQAVSEKNTQELIDTLEQAILGHEGGKPTKKFEKWVTQLIKAANINAKTNDDDKFTILHLAVMTGNPNIIKSVLKAGGDRDLNTPDSKGRTPVQLAAQLKISLENLE